MKDLFLFVDTETSGLKAGWNEICEVSGILTHTDLTPISEMHQKIKIYHPERFSPKAKEINGYDEAVWAKEAVDFSMFKNWLSKNVPSGCIAIPIGHNVGFDIDMIKEGYYPRGTYCPMSYHSIDTVGLSALMRLAGVFKSDDLKLVSVTKALGIPHSNAHTAEADNRASMAVFEMAMDLLKLAVGKLVPTAA